MPVIIPSELLLSPVRQIHPEFVPKPGYILREDFEVEWNGNSIRIPEGFGYNGASIPMAMFQLIGTPFNPRYMEAACVHDWLYYTHLIESRTEADRLFRTMLLEGGVNRTIANNLFQAVFVFGRLYWNNRRKDQKYLQWLRAQLQANSKKPAEYGL
jgi:hypothetical protein